MIFMVYNLQRFRRAVGGNKAFLRLALAALRRVEYVVDVVAVVGQEGREQRHYHTSERHFAQSHAVASCRPVGEERKSPYSEG